MSIALVQEVKKLAVEVAYLRHALERQSEEIESLRHVVVELTVELDGIAGEVAPIPTKRGPGRPKKVVQQ